MPETGPLVLVSGADDAYALPLAVTLHSALHNLSPDVEPRVHVVDGGISEENRGRLQETVARAREGASIRWFVPDVSALDDLWVAGHVSAATYFSLLVPDAVPEDVDWAIYLDSDVQVEADLATLREEPLGDRPLLAVQDCLIPYASWPGGPVCVRGVDGAAGRPYFNAGVMVLNLSRWRREGLSAEVFGYLRQHEKELTFRDQEGLNAVLGSEAGLLDPKWNVPTSLLWLERWPESSFKERMRLLRPELLRSPAIWHFVGPSKPWHGGYSHPAGDRWHSYREAAGWPLPAPGPGHDLGVWLDQQRLDDEEIASLVPADAALVLVGDSCRLPLSIRGRRALPFLERDGVYRGNPPDDEVAVRELDRMRRSGSRFIAFDRTALWWLDHYRGFADHLRAMHSCVRESDHLVVFELCSPHG